MSDVFVFTLVWDRPSKSKIVTEYIYKKYCEMLFHYRSSTYKDVKSDIQIFVNPIKRNQIQNQERAW